ncbi:hypothetical protein DYU05_05785 [Mucilaginibacter terrenus]|uniref:Lantibiotic dehydratase n=1 Tax=Mucilaginibacter terrenus TaxID=2482727 RepID=A0A3E2NVU3_9SPHI|nr:lantibiotic dehydratase [Mucilaginibacter terrenus]RFZ85112.1 hypothetical protein DYU05_05785 [Mucilaginibacter terrenus]
MDCGYKLLDDLFLRTPYYSYTQYDPAALPDVLRDPVFQNAVYLASTGLYKLMESNHFDHERLDTKARLAALKYYNRMSYRPVPYGLFAGFTLLQWDDTGVALLGGERRSKLHLLPDQHWLQSQEDQNSQKQKAKRVCLNPLLYRCGTEYRFVRSVQDEQYRLQFSLQALEAEPFYERLFAYLVKSGSKPGTVLGAISRLGDCTPEEATDFFSYLLKEQVLLSEKQQSAIAVSPSTHYRFLPRQTPGFHLKQGTVAALAADKVVSAESGEQSFYAAFQRPLESGGPSPDVKAELERGLRLMQRIAKVTENALMQQFKKEFQRKFDQREVPLLTALDPDMGIAYTGLTDELRGEDELLEGLRFPQPQPGPAPQRWTMLHRFLMARWQRARERGEGAVLEIDEKDFDTFGLEASKVNFPNTTAVMFRTVVDHVVLEQAGGATGTALLGRFSAFDKEAAALCRKIAALEQQANPDIIFADIGQVSDAHVDNINRRERIFNYEIPLNVFSNLPRKYQLRPDELTIVLQNDELVLFSTRLGKRVIPRLASAYNPARNGLSIFRFLSDLQHEGLATAFSLDLENFFPGLDFYPRVASGRLVLSPAKWRITGGIERLRGATPEETFVNVRHFRMLYQLPQRVVMGDHDQVLVFDLGERDEAVFFAECLKGKKSVRLQEYFWPGRSTKSNGKPLAGQFVAVAHHRQPVYQPFLGNIRRVPASLTRAYPPGSEWLYLKIYCSPAAAANLLLLVVQPLLQQFREQAEQWFFVRYKDPGDHIRLRIKVAPAEAGAMLHHLQRLVREARLETLVQELQLDTYQPELERYGAEMMPFAEAVFCEGSKLVLSFLGRKAPGHAASSPFGLGVLSAWLIISGFIEEVSEAQLFCDDIALRFLEEFGAVKDLKQDVDSRYRLLRSEIELLTAIISGGNLEAELPGSADLKDKVRLCRTASAKLTETERRRLVADLVHMQVNRTFRSRQRQQELLVYYCLAKLLRSLIYRSAKSVY